MFKVENGGLKTKNEICCVVLHALSLDDVEKYYTLHGIMFLNLNSTCFFFMIFVLTWI